MDKKIEQIKRLQEEKDRRKEIEDEAIRLIEQGRTAEACELLQTLDDSIAEELMEEDEPECSDCVPGRAETIVKAVWVMGHPSGLSRVKQDTAGYCRVKQGIAVLSRVT